MTDPNAAMPDRPLPLYPRLLGSDWNLLAESVRAAHLQTGSAEYVGTMSIRHGNRLARCLAKLAGLPAAGDGIPARLRISGDAETETWTRDFGGTPLATTQWAGADGLLVEKLGLMEYHFRLSVREAGIDYAQIRTRLRLGPLSLPIPRVLQPTIIAAERPGSEPGTSSVSVRISLPLLGLLAQYQGVIQGNANDADGADVAADPGNHRGV